MRLLSYEGWGGPDPWDLPEGAEPAGYAWMVRSRSLDVMPHHRWSFVARVGARSTFVEQDIVWEVFPIRYRPEGLAEQIEFALKYDGVNLEILRAWFESVSPEETRALEQWIAAAPTSAYARRAWFFYELLTDRRLSAADARAGAYTGALDPERYHVVAGARSKRHRVVDNLLGTRDFSPMVRHTPEIAAFAGRDLHRRIEVILRDQDPQVLTQMTTWLYTKETRSSFEIERETPSPDKLRRFVQVLRQAHDWPDLSKVDLVRLQNLIVADPRSQDSDFRHVQNYVGGPGPREIVFVSPKPEDLPAMMHGWLAMTRRLVSGDVDPVVGATAASFGFVYLHPFEDGNGRIHRFLIHYVLARMGFSPPGALVPVSATMLAKMAEYDAALDRFSKPLLNRIRYDLDREYRLEVQGKSAGYYRYPDLTAQAEALYGWVAAAIEEDVPKELAFLLAYRDARRRVSEIVELPDRALAHLLGRCLENGGTLSNTRRRRDFPTLTDDEVEAIGVAVREAMRAHGMPGSRSLPAMQP